MLTQPTKYQKRYKCCNDTYIGCQLLCCKRFNKFLEDDVLDVDESDKDHFIWEKVVDQSVKQINDNWSWASAGLLATATAATIAFDDSIPNLVSYWLYFIIMFIIGIIISVIAHCFTPTDDIAKKLEIEVPKKKAALGDKKEKQKLNQIIEKAKAKHVKNDKTGNIERILNFVEIEGNALFDNLETLFLAILSNVIALALNDAAQHTFKEIIGSSEGGLLLTSYWIFAFIASWFCIAVNVRIGAYINKLEIKEFDNLKKVGIDNAHKDLRRFATIKRIFKLLTHITGFVFAWALRDAMKETILSLYGGSGTSTTIAAIWTYTIVVTLLVSWTNTVFSRYYFLYPRDDTIESSYSSSGRKLAQKIMYKNWQTIVGLAWYDVLLESPEHLDDDDVSKHKIWILWVEVIVVLLLNAILTALWQKTKMVFQTKMHGPVQAFYDAFSSLYDPLHVLKEGYYDKKNKEKEQDDNDDNGKNKDIVSSSNNVEKNKRDTFWFDYIEKLIDLILYAFGIAGSLLVGDAIKYTLTDIYSVSYNPATVDDVSGDVIWSVYLSFGIVLLISTVMMTYLSRIVKSIRSEKHKIFNRWRESLKDSDKQLNIKDDQDGKTNNIEEEEDKNLINNNGDNKKTDKIEMI